eukprot:scaffold58066_cov17-Tisochrysis_lutea.AAC.1
MGNPGYFRFKGPLVRPLPIRRSFLNARDLWTGVFCCFKNEQCSNFTNTQEIGEYKKPSRASMSLYCSMVSRGQRAFSQFEKSTFWGKSMKGKGYKA